MFSEMASSHAIDCDPLVSPAFLTRLCGFLEQVPAAIIADDVLTTDPQAAALVKKYPMLLLACEGTPQGEEGFYSLQPQFVEMERDQIIEDLKKRLVLNCSCCEIGLEQLLLAAGVIESRSRRNPGLIDLSVEELGKADVVSKVQEFVRSI
jgi:hypothetical protein